MKLIKGDILSNIDKSKNTVILHGCNCFHTMGAGIALYLKNKYPRIYTADCNTPYGNVDKMGTFSYLMVEEKLFIFNLYTQFNCNMTRDVDYEAVYKSLSKVGDLVNSQIDKGNRIEVRSPQIGCGLAGGEWSIVEKMYEHLIPSAKIYYI